MRATSTYTHPLRSWMQGRGSVRSMFIRGRQSLTGGVVREQFLVLGVLYYAALYGPAQQWAHVPFAFWQSLTKESFVFRHGHHHLRFSKLQYNTTILPT
ncbi:hypothetical protein CEP53_001932 [Fusarium sp. AF-6]|nr:hypothetical protein CEP53_001932 [Fusarium sp. AF-6]